MQVLTYPPPSIFFMNEFSRPTEGKKAQPNAAFKHSKFAAEYVRKPDAERAAMKAGYKKARGRQLLMNPDIRQKIEEGLSDAALAAGVSRAWVISKLKEVAERCMQAQPVKINGIETGMYVFDASGANRSLELLGKHLKVFGDDASAATQVGAAVIRLLAQEAQQGRRGPRAAVEAQVVPRELKEAPAVEPADEAIVDEEQPI